MQFPISETPLKTKFIFTESDAAQAASDAAAAAAAAHTGSTTNVHPFLSSMVNYTHPIKFQGIIRLG
jgi:hypothetical protein